jgi:hypothetical protein
MITLRKIEFDGEKKATLKKGRISSYIPMIEEFVG